MNEQEFLLLCKLKNNEGLNDIKDYIISKGKWKNFRNSNGEHPLHIAVKANNNEVVDYLISLNINPFIKDNTKLEKTPIIIAIEKGYVDIIFTLLSSKNIKPFKTKFRYSEFSALSKTKKINNTEFKSILIKLIDIGLDINILDNTKNTILTKTIENNDIERVKIILTTGINLNNEENLPLHTAFFQKEQNNNIIKLLLTAGATIYIKSTEEWNNGYSALDDAHTRHNVEIFELLIVKYNALDNISDELLEGIINFKEIEFLKFLWKLPKVKDFITDNNLEEAFPEEIRNVFIF